MKPRVIDAQPVDVVVGCTDLGAGCFDPLEGVCEDGVAMDGDLVFA